MNTYPIITALNILAWIILIGSLAMFIYRIVKTKCFRPSFLLFLILPISQLITLYSLAYDTWTIFWLLGVLFGVGANFALLAYTISQENKTELEEELKETQHLLELEQAHYFQVEERRGELEIIRNDFNSRLYTVAALVRQGEDNSARDLITALAEKINQTKENPYCGIPIINAILTEKARECAEHGIKLNIDLNLPNTIDTPQMHLCSIFSNLMDNAIAGSVAINPDIDQAADTITPTTATIQEMKPATATPQPTIRLSSIAEGDYLFIKAVNPSLDPKAAKGKIKTKTSTKTATANTAASDTANTPPPRGYGSKILTDLSTRYGGSYQAEYKNGYFTAVVSLLVAR